MPVKPAPPAPGVPPSQLGLVPGEAVGGEEGVALCPQTGVRLQSPGCRSSPSRATLTVPHLVSASGHQL